MNILSLIKHRKSCRCFDKRSISTKVLEKIVEAGVWGPSLVGKQPPYFVVIKDRNKIDKITTLTRRSIKRMGTSGRILYLNSTVSALQSASVLILIFNTRILAESMSGFARIENKSKASVYFKRIEHAEISAIAASIQNMVLVAEYLRVGSCWLDMPVFAEKSIKKFLRIDNDKKMIAILALGYPVSVRGVRSPRKAFRKSVKYL